MSAEILNLFADALGVPRPTDDRRTIDYYPEGSTHGFVTLRDDATVDIELHSVSIPRALAVLGSLRT